MLVDNRKLTRALNEVRALQRKQIDLLIEFQHAKRFELLQSKFNRFYILKDGHSIEHKNNNTTVIRFVSSIGQIKSYFKLHGVKMSMLLDTDGLKKTVFNHKRRGKR